MNDEKTAAPYETLGGEGGAEIRVQRSRFVAYAAPAGDEHAARAYVETVARRHHDARHVCWAARFGPGDGIGVLQRFDEGAYGLATPTPGQCQGRLATNLGGRVLKQSDQ